MKRSWEGGSKYFVFCEFIVPAGTKRNFKLWILKYATKNYLPYVPRKIVSHWVKGDKRLSKTPRTISEWGCQREGGE